ncbi:hypothetical protein Droror1_Dr00026112 [Drosera rotundifolia]
MSIPSLSFHLPPSTSSCSFGASSPSPVLGKLQSSFPRDLHRVDMEDRMHQLRKLSLPHSSSIEEGCEKSIDFEGVIVFIFSGRKFVHQSKKKTRFKS